MLTAAVVNGAWSVEGVDLTSFADGSITIEADTIDMASNPASAVKRSTGGHCHWYRLLTVIDIDTLDGFSILAFRSSQHLCKILINVAKGSQFTLK